MLKLSRVIESLRVTLWSQAVIRSVRHERVEGGGHRLVIDLDAADVDDDMPREMKAPAHATLGASVGAEPTEPTKPVKKS